MFLNDFSYCHILLSYVTALCEHSIIVVACYIGSKSFIVVSTAHKAEVCTTDKHIHIKTTLSEHIINDFCIVFSACCVVVLVSPCVKPTIPHFHAHFRLVGEEFIVSLEVFFYSATEVESCHTAVNSTIKEVIFACTIRCEEWYVNTHISVALIKMLEVLFIVTIVAVFIFALKHNDWAAICAKKRSDLLKHLSKISVKIFYVRFVAATDFHIILRLNPPGKSTEFPFSTDVRTGTYDSHKTLFSRNCDKFSNVKVTAEVKLTFLFFVHIPGTVCFNAVKTHSSHFLEDISPSVRHISEIMHCT